MRSVFSSSPFNSQRRPFLQAPSGILDPTPQARQFGRKSEQADPNQLELFDSKEFDDAVEEAKVLTVSAHTRTKKSHPEMNGRVDLPEDLEREEILLDLPESEKSG
ncbi:MAG: hypothetical protein EOM63_07035, partial [Clostridia bacterium]|nr:hypothetical protein [Clostridia bacterium]